MTQMQKTEKTEKKKHYKNNKFFTKLEKTREGIEIFAFCVITFKPIRI